MKFYVDYGDIKNFRKSSKYKSVHDSQWFRFWKWIGIEEFPVNESLSTLADEYFIKVEPKRIIHLSDKEFIKQLGDLYSEHRVDLVEIIVSHEQDKLPADWKTYREHRFITFMIPTLFTNLDHELECLYDTYTGHLEVAMNLPGGTCWKPLDGVKYED